MTIRIQHLSIVPDAHVWLSAHDGIDATGDETLRFDLLSLVRHIMRDEPCNMVPVVRAFVTHPTNRYGHNAQVEVTYHTSGYRAIYGAHLGEKVTNVVCYAD